MTRESSATGKTRCRFAPSPTGELHVGGARTALFNYLFARHTGGTYILRIEDTDRERSTEAATAGIFNGLGWLGLTPDEGPYYQSERLELYRQYAQQLLREGAAYPCTCTQQDLEKIRAEQAAAGLKPRYDRRHRPPDAPGSWKSSPQSDQLPLGSESEPFVVRIRLPLDGATVFDDLVLGTIATPNEELDDFIIIRSDGTPTYNFCVVVDDIDLAITHVIRGNDHISNTPKQVAIYQALGAPLPVFAHVPMILGADKKKLSKRHGATSVFEYRKDGYLPSAFNNCLARLGWSCGDREIFSPQELEELFTLEQVGKSAAVFDIEKLRWINGEHIKRTDSKDLASMLPDYLPDDLQQYVGDSFADDPSLLILVEGLKERCATLVEMAEQCRWYLQPEDTFAARPEVAAINCSEEIKQAIQKFTEAAQQLSDFSAPNLEQSFKTVLEESKLKFGKLAQPLRLSLTGTTGGLPLFTIMEILGQNRTLHRLQRFS